MQPLAIDGNSLNLNQLYRVAFDRCGIKILKNASQKMQGSRDCIEEILAGGKIVYGVNTGFGKLANVHIQPDEIEALQHNLVLSHACGIGDSIPEPIVRAAMLLKINALCKGYSGTRPVLATYLCDLLNRGITPCIPEKGSVGASGDLAPLAHMTLVLLGMGEAFVDGKKMRGAEALKAAGLEPLTLKAKEGLAILNGTQITTAFAAVALRRAMDLVKAADIAGALTVESLLHTKTAFDDRIQMARAYPYQIKVARNLQNLLVESEIIASHKGCEKIQDPYSSRCIPQVHGAVRQALDFVEEVVNTELNAATDNPLVFAEDKTVLSGGNFHAQPLSLASDTLAIALAQLANISERRLENLMDSNQSGLPPFLASDSGKNSGFMMAQVTAAALVSENKVLCHPASVDSIPTSANQEDFVSMGTHAARKAFEVLQNAETIIGIELLAGCQALDFREHRKPGKGTRLAYKSIRDRIATMPRDRLFQKDLMKIKALIEKNTIVKNVEKGIGLL